MARKKAVHLTIRRGVACGIPNATLHTHDPAHVTCGGCRRTVEMADAEILWARKPRKR